MLLNVDEELKRFMAENVADGEFEPVAYYDEAGGFICVLMKDCSYYEEEPRFGDIFVIFRKNNRPSNIVGFIIKGAYKLLEIIGLPQQGKLKLCDILKAISISARLDDSWKIQSVELLAFLSLNECNDLEIEMP